MSTVTARFLNQYTHISPSPELVVVFPQLCVEKLGKSAGALASVPLISESESSQAEDESLHSFTCGTFMKMTKYDYCPVHSPF
ncbi:MAG: hypothetical protein ACRDDG_00610, partial [Cetobacterium sp.]